jgi:hypothetical protein
VWARDEVPVLGEVLVLDGALGVDWVWDSVDTDPVLGRDLEATDRHYRIELWCSCTSETS